MNVLDQKRLLLERSLLESLAQMLSHDINGKVMGVEGILSCWETLGVEPANVQEDITVVRDSFHEVKGEFLLLNWFFQSEAKFAQAIELNYFHEVSGRFLARLFHPRSSFEFIKPGDGRSVSCTPAELIFWSASVCRMLSLCRPKEQPVSLRIDAGSEGTCLVIHIISEFFQDILSGQGQPAQQTDEYALWWDLFQQAGGKSDLNPQAEWPITLTIPFTIAS
jgi:hypothetical protein